MVNVIQMIRQRQQLEDKLNQTKLDRVKIEAPHRNTSLFNRQERSESMSSKLSNKTNPSSQRQIIARPIYQETYYISGIRQNYLTLISDNMEILQLPLGLIKDDIKIGHPIKLKLQYDTRRQQQDDNRFKGIQKDLYKEFHQKNNQN